MMANGEPIDERKFTTSAQLGRQEVVGILDPVAVMKLIQDGATLILQGCRRYGRNIDSFVGNWIRSWASYTGRYF